MSDFLDYKSPNFLFGSNVHNALILVTVVAIAIKVKAFTK